MYHVGIYSSARARPSPPSTRHEGVNWQQIWDPTWVTYGSFSHT